MSFSEERRQKITRPPGELTKRYFLLIQELCRLKPSPGCTGDVEALQSAWSVNTHCVRARPSLSCIQICTSGVREQQRSLNHSGSQPSPNVFVNKQELTYFT